MEILNVNLNRTLTLEIVLTTMSHDSFHAHFPSLSDHLPTNVPRGGLGSVDRAYQTPPVVRQCHPGTQDVGWSRELDV